MKGYIQKIATTLIDRVVDRISQRMNDGRLADDIAYRTLAETSLVVEMADKRPNDLFSGISDGFWFWLCTEGYRRIPELRKVLPSMPPEDVQLMFTGDKGDPVLREGFSAYVLFRDLYQSHVGPLANSAGIMDFGCGWGRIIRFFLKDIDPTRLYGVDPVDEMVSLCKERDRWCTFERISPKPPMRFQDNAFDLIYSFSVFSHLSEEMHKRWLVELRRVLKPGGLFIATTRGREFIEYCGQMRRCKDLAVMHPGPGSSASAIPKHRKELV
jgi:SAM-dependent methyltransferase